MTQIGEAKTKMIDFLQSELKIEGDAIRVLQILLVGHPLRDPGGDDGGDHGGLLPDETAEAPSGETAEIPLC